MLAHPSNVRMVADSIPRTRLWERRFSSRCRISSLQVDKCCCGCSSWCRIKPLASSTSWRIGLRELWRRIFLIFRTPVRVYIAGATTVARVSVIPHLPDCLRGEAQRAGWGLPLQRPYCLSSLSGALAARPPVHKKPAAKPAANFGWGRPGPRQPFPTPAGLGGGRDAVGGGECGSFDVPDVQV